MLNNRSPTQKILFSPTKIWLTIIIINLFMRHSGIITQLSHNRKREEKKIRSRKKIWQLQKIVSYYGKSLVSSILSKRKKKLRISSNSPSIHKSKVLSLFFLTNFNQTSFWSVLNIMRIIITHTYLDSILFHYKSSSTF